MDPENPRPAEPIALTGTISPCELILEMGPDWFSCADIMPWSDCHSTLKYVVYSPSYGGELMVCKFLLRGPVQWWSEHNQVGISGVTHWRIATPEEMQLQCFISALPTVSSFDSLAHEQLFRWWDWYQWHYLGRERPAESVELIEDDKSYAYKLKSTREAADLSQAHLADASGISLARIRSYESGASKPRYAALYDLAKALNVAPQFFE
ncbi:helix-turn-helix transcriptional regulator [Pseudomonas alliivorans]|nr:helix-turn-helix transcriptional regulator [Pseudomonas alliivorans]